MIDQTRHEEQANRTATGITTSVWDRLCDLIGLHVPTVVGNDPAFCYGCGWKFLAIVLTEYEMLILIHLIMEF
jgi:hypothetical protein